MDVHGLKALLLWSRFAIWCLILSRTCQTEIHCGEGEFYSDSTRKCQPCLFFCGKDEALHILPISCLKKCLACPQHEYLDTDTRTCRGCEEICHQAEVRGTEKQCRELCPVDGFVTLDITTNWEVQDEYKNTPSGDVHQEHQVPDESGRPIAAVTALMAVSIMVTITAMLILMDVHRTVYRRFIRKEEKGAINNE